MPDFCSDEINIFPLNEKPEYAPILAYLSFNEWYLNRNVPFEAILREYKKRAHDEAIPCSFIALQGTYPAGMVSLKENDLWSRRDLAPWLSSLWVHPDFRKKGIGERLINAVISSAVSEGFGRIYLFLDNKEINYLRKYYMKRGWTFFSECYDNDGAKSEIYCLEL